MEVSSSVFIMTMTQSRFVLTRYVLTFAYSTATLFTGTGRVVSVIDEVNVVNTIFGSSASPVRSAECKDCGEGHGPTAELRLPTDVAQFNNNTVIVADDCDLYSLDSSRIATYLTTLPGQDSGCGRVYLGAHPRLPIVYVSFPKGHQVFKFDGQNLTVFAGTGQQCDMNEGSCGDNGKATMAQFVANKGIAAYVRSCCHSSTHLTRRLMDL